jgi:limonene-1,2-epoxide hydrolase
MADAREIVATFQQAMGRGDFVAARTLLRDDISFRGPIGAFDSADALMEALKKLQRFIERVEIKKIFADGDEVCVLFALVTNTPGGTVLVAEWYCVEGGRIAMMRAMFDARPLAAMLGGTADPA